VTITGIQPRGISQREPLKARLRSLIRGYPKGLGIIKEFLQNADDAGATHVDIVIDWRTHSISQIPSPEYDRLAGPALLIANNAQFSDADFSDILALGQSGKRLASTKIGKFGLGFNAAYNVTDHPCLVSRDQLFILDPNRTVVAKETSEDGVSYSLTPELWAAFPDLLTPFIAGGLPASCVNHPGTVFRLPLRDKRAALESEISKEQFVREDFDDILGQLTKRAGDLLIFLQNLLSVRVAVITPEGVRSNIFEVVTTNEPEVSAGRAVAQRWLDASGENQIARLRSPGDQPLVATYHHRMLVELHGITTSEAHWLVCNGVHSGPKGELLDLSEAMFNEGEKATPVAGAAVKLLYEGERLIGFEPTSGQVYCGLPLPRTIPLGVHLNGYFDLDDNRQWLRLSRESVGTHERQRDQWNRALIFHGAAAAYATLLSAIAPKLSSAEAGAFYELWPHQNPATEDSLPGLVAALYRHVAAKELKVLRVEKEDQWKPSTTIALVPDNWHDRLLGPLSAEGENLPVPTLPGHIINGFVAAGNPLAEIAPKHLRNRWRKKKDLAVDLAAAPCAAWRNKEWVISLLEFILSDGAGDLLGIPLALLCDGKLHTFGYCPSGSVFLATEKERELFPRFLNWFVDPELAERSGLTPNGPAKVVLMDVRHVLLSLSKILPSQDMASWVEDAHQEPNAEWLLKVVSYLDEQKAFSSSNNVETFKTLSIVPDQFGRLHKPGTTGTPLWPVEKTNAWDCSIALDAFEVPIVHGSAKFLESLRSAVALSEDDLIGNVSGPDLVDMLEATTGHWGNEATVYAKAVQEPLVTFLAQAVDDYSEEQLEVLANLPIFPTKDGGLVTPRTSGVFVPAEASFPEPPNDVRFLQTGPRGGWRPLLKKLKARTFNRVAMLRSFRDSSFAGLASNHRLELLTWLRDHLDQTLGEINEGERVAIMEQLAACEMLPGEDGKLHAANKMYDPTATVVREILGERSVFPVFDSTMSTQRDLWLTFYHRLGMANSLRASDILTYVDDLVAEAEVVGVKAVSEKLLGVFDYIRDHWEAVGTQMVDDSGSAEELRSVLRRRSWLPAQVKPERLKQFAGFVVPADRLYRPEELYPAILGHLVASQSPVFHTVLNKELHRDLGFPSRATLEVVAAHFDHLLGLWESENHSGLQAESIGKTLGAIYRELGNRVGDDTTLDEREDTDEDVEQITLGEFVDRFSERSCLWDQDRQRFWPPHQAFKVPVPYFADRRAHLVISDARADLGYTALGRRETLTAADVVAFLNEVQQEYLGAELPAPLCEHILRLYRVVVDSDLLNDPEILQAPVLTSNNTLLSSVDVFDNDDPQRADRLEVDDVYVVHADVPVRLTKCLNLMSIAGAFSEQLLDTPLQAADPHAISLCASYDRTLRSDEFRNGVARFITHRDSDAPIGRTTWLRQLEVRAVEPFSTELHLTRPAAPSRIVGQSKPPLYFDEDIIYLSIDAIETAPTLIAHALAKRLGQSFGDLSPLAAIVGARPSRIAAILDNLRVRTAQVEMDFADVIPEDSSIPMSFADVGDDDYTLNELFDDPDTADDEAATPRENAGITTELLSEPGGFSLDEGEECGAGDCLDRESPAEHTHVDPTSETSFRDRVETASRNSANASAGSAASAGTANDSSVDPIAGRQESPTEAAATDPTMIRGRPWSPNETSSPGPRSHRSAHSGTSSQPGTKAAQARVVTYLSASSNLDRIDDEANDETPENIEIGRAAEEFVAEVERQSGRRVERMPHNNPGFDIISDGEVNDHRIIEVKGLKGEWGSAGVPVSATQFSTAWQERDNFWLYIVEYALDPERRSITRINDPVSQVTQYRVDSGWRSLAATKFAQATLPRIGDSVEFMGGETGLVIDIDEAGALAQVTVEFANGQRKKSLFRPNEMFVKRSE
jgi:sacsin